MFSSHTNLIIGTISVVPVFFMHPLASGFVLEWTDGENFDFQNCHSQVWLQLSHHLPPLNSQDNEINEIPP